MDRGSLSAASARELLFLLLERQDVIMSAIDDIKEDLEAAKVDLSDIKAAVTVTVHDLQAKVSELTDQVTALKAGDELTAQQLAGLVQTADDVRVSAEDILGVVIPPSV